MKKIKNKGRVYPSPCSSNDGDSFSVLKLLPAAILALASVLCLEDREVLAYLITRSIKTTATASSKKAAANEYDHKPPVFGCVCFDCYTSYWFRWDSSPNRELIHQAIEAFEDHLTNDGGGDDDDETDHHNHNKYKKNGKHKTKRRDKTARRFANKSRQLVAVEETEAAAVAAETFPENYVAVAPVSSPDKEPKRLEKEEEEEDDVVVVEFSGKSTPVDDETPAVLWLPAAAASSCWHKGLARKVLPDVLGLFNSRLWSLWSPNA